MTYYYSLAFQFSNQIIEVRCPPKRTLPVLLTVLGKVNLVFSFYYLVVQRSLSSFQYHY